MRQGEGAAPRTLISEGIAPKTLISEGTALDPLGLAAPNSFCLQLGSFRNQVPY